ncbi:MAG TPA: NUDIX domain-containing protein [Nocardioidaceae bacterium]|nr:NUDIX domain-containing protein [Nocardioidaceae bacterium]
MAPRAVAVVVDDGAVLVMHRLSDGAAYYTLPGGSVEDGESIEQACTRELHEETGLHGRIVGQVMTLDNRGRTEHYVLMTAERGELRVGEPEASRTSATNRYCPMWVPLTELADVNLRTGRGATGRDASPSWRGAGHQYGQGSDVRRGRAGVLEVATELSRRRRRLVGPAAPARVADVGAGTGKLTSLLVDRGLVVEAVEPDRGCLPS